MLYSLTGYLAEEKERTTPAKEIQYGRLRDFCQPYNTGYKTSFQWLNSVHFLSHCHPCFWNIATLHFFRFYDRPLSPHPRTFIPRCLHNLTFWQQANENWHGQDAAIWQSLILVNLLKNNTLYKKLRFQSNWAQPASWLAWSNFPAAHAHGYPQEWWITHITPLTAGPAKNRPFIFLDVSEMFFSYF